MLIEFRFKNFRSFRDETTFSMVASSDKELLNNTIGTKALGKMRLNHSAVIYGPNAAGKSNLIKAMAFVEDFVRQSVGRNSAMDIPVSSFLLDERSKAGPSEFEITFLVKGIRYEYGFVLDSKRIYQEWLIAYPKGSAQIWFERPKDSIEPTEWYFGRHLKGEKNRLVPLTRPDVLFLSVAAQFNHQQLKPIYEWFTNELVVLDYNEAEKDLERITISFLQNRPEFQDEFREMLQFSDIGIVDFSIVDTESTNGNGNIENGLHKKRIQLHHQSSEFDESGIPIDFGEESLGSQRLIKLAPILLSRLKPGGIIFIDELDSSFHPLLVREIVKWFHDPQRNVGRAQLIFTTHDTSLLDQTLFRRDQIWFTEKSREGVTTLYSLLEYKPRKSEALSRGYLQGRYGAVPFFDDGVLDVELAS